DFAIAAGTTCTNGATVVASASCLLNLTFTPTAASARTATVTITDDAPGSPQSVSLTGTGVTPPTATLSATSSAFGNQRVGTTSAAQNLTLTNNGGTPLNLASKSTRLNSSHDSASSAVYTCPTRTGSVAPGASCTISISFTPAATAATTATVTITYSPPPRPLPSFPTRRSSDLPTATLSATSSAFGNQRVGTTSAAQNLTLTNNGGTPLNLISITITGAQAADFAFAAGNTCPTGAGSVAPGASCTISISFTPAATGARTATVTITDDAPGSPQSVSLAGMGIAPAVTLAPTNLAFGDQRLSTTSPAQTVTLTNSGTATLSITSIALAGSNPGDFAIAAGTTCTNGATVVAGASCLINLTFTPTAASARTATVTITDDAASSPQSVSLAGTGIVPAVTLAPTNLAFGTQRLSTTSPAQHVPLTN